MEAGWWPGDEAPKAGHLGVPLPASAEIPLVRRAETRSFHPEPFPPLNRELGDLGLTQAGPQRLTGPWFFPSAQLELDQLIRERRSISKGLFFAIPRG